ncbi:MBL fold metallo-hydrolase [Candidatus Pacearchaeota archaeon]|nr:MBL fold metallo-hydrolase [Candidatus Pacearchaeota archaeon]
MRLIFHGVRGSYPQPDARMIQYGGRTTCLQITSAEGKHYLVDAGNGIIPAGKKMYEIEGKTGKVSLLFTHLHRDHLEGFPFFRLAYEKGWYIHLYGGHTALLEELDKLPQATGKIIQKGKTRSNAEDLRQALRTLQDTNRGFFPIPLAGMQARLYFHAVAEGIPLENEEEMHITPHYHTLHPQNMWAYAFEEHGRKLFFTGDIETTGSLKKRENNRLVRAMMHVHTLVADGQYTPEEYETRQGWGHSTYEGILTLADRAGVQNVILTHHDPDHTDAVLDGIEIRAKRYARETLKSRMNVSLARETMYREI